jgi:hypothetical protein
LHQSWRISSDRALRTLRIEATTAAAGAQIAFAIPQHNRALDLVRFAELTLTHRSILMTNTKILVEKAATNSHLRCIATLVFTLPRNASVEQKPVADNPSIQWRTT